MRVQGFSLIECLVYILLLTILTSMTFTWVASVHKRLTCIGTACNQTTQLYAAHDALARDLACASKNKEQWKKITDSCCIWSTNNRDICWQLEDRKLVRLAGTYNATTQSWQKKVKNIVATGVKKIEFILIVNNGQIQVVTSQLDGTVNNKEYSTMRTVVPKNGLLI